MEHWFSCPDVLCVIIVVIVSIVVVVIIVLVFHGLALHVFVEFKVVVAILVVVIISLSLLTSQTSGGITVRLTTIIIISAVGFHSLTSGLVGFVLALYVGLGKIPKVDKVLSTLPATGRARTPLGTDGKFRKVLREHARRCSVISIAAAASLSSNLNDRVTLVKVHSVVYHPCSINFILLEPTSAFHERCLAIQGARRRHGKEEQGSKRDDNLHLCRQAE